MLHRLGESLCRQGVEYVVPGEPRTPRLQYAVADFVEVRSVMGIGVDHDLYTFLFGLAQVHVVEIEAVGVGV